MLAELPEEAAEGRTAGIYHDVRRLWAVAYVSSLQRHLATIPGMLEWAWDALAPAFQCGRAQEQSWAVADSLDLVPIKPLSGASLARLGVEDTDCRTIGDVCAGFVRVAPVNMMFAGFLRKLLNGETPNGAGWSDASWQPPAALPAPPAMVDGEALDEAQRQVLSRLGTNVAGTPFVPGLYRILARWPGFLRHLANVLEPVSLSPETDTARAALLSGIDRSVDDVFRDLPATITPPPAHDSAALQRALDTYRQTSPEMVIFGTLIANHLPREVN